MLSLESGDFLPEIFDGAFHVGDAHVHGPILHECLVSINCLAVFLIAELLICLKKKIDIVADDTIVERIKMSIIL